ncbi:DUF4365 domain-containing protein [Aquimarina macrocephali]|uniref:DUF4365 domain-containing protein n=1 Tax=Aquimarina macrocephali TaxID=666563 RepID=UPI003F68140A
MTTEQIKEQLSNKFIGILANNKGFALDKPDLDIGVDYQLKKIYTYITPKGKTRYNYDSRYIDLQLKATTENSIIDEPDFLKYDLEAKTYNDLIERQENGTAPLILILFILPYDQNSWVNINHDEIKLRKHAYWYKPTIGSVATKNAHRIRIDIPKLNKLGIDCFNELHQLFYP